jgi:ribulose-bisphosphate carboxylase large chain
MTTDRIVSTYWIETPYPVERAAEMLAGEQSTGTFVAIPGETDELKERFRARVENIRLLETVDTPSLPDFRSPKSPDGKLRFYRAEVSVSIPLEMTGTDLTAALAAVMGNVSELGEASGIRLLDLEFPPAFVEGCPRPQFGIAGTRRLAGVYERPIIGSIIKPSVGLTPEQTAAMVRELAQAGIDFVKDDELIANPPYSPLEKRVAAVMRVINQHAERTGKQVMYAFNISDDRVDAMLRHHDLVLAAGGTCLMLSINHVGLAAVMAVRRRAQLPIHAHRNGWGMLTRCPSLGIDYRAYQKIWRLAGVDQLHVNGLQNKFWEPDDSVVRSIQACLTPLFRAEDCLMPVVSSGQWGGQAPETYRRTQTVDVMYLAGGGIQAHPGGPAAGVAAIRQAWEAARAGIALEEYARDHVELRQALEKFGKRN